MMTAMTGFAVGKIMVVTKGDKICFPDASNELKNGKSSKQIFF